MKSFCSVTLLAMVLQIELVHAGLASGLPNGVAAGDVTSTSVVLWARSAVLGPMTFLWSPDPSFASRTPSVETNVTDSLRPVKVEVAGLEAGTTYFYRATDAAGNSAAGRFRTAAPAGELRGLRFGVSGDWRGELAPYPSLANAAARDLDFFVELGDTIYADVPSPAVPSAQARTVAEFRAKHNEVYSARFGLNALGDLRASTATFAVIDDHEISNNFAGATPLNADTLMNESALYRTALQVFHEYNPIQERSYDTPADPRTHGKPKLYRMRRFGSEAAIFLLDARSFRDPELPEVRNPLNPDDISAFTSLSFDLDPKTGAPRPRRTLLGAAQLAELKADLLAAKTEGGLWKFVLVPEPIQNFGFADGPDRFEGYATERTELLRFINDAQMKNVVFISADIHGTVINNIDYQTGPNQPNVATAAFEVVTGPVAYDKTFGPTVFDVAEGIQILPGINLLQLILRDIEVPNRAAFDALPRADKDRLFKKVMDLQLTTSGFDASGLDGSPQILASLSEGNYVAVHSYGWTEFEIDGRSHSLTVTTYGITPYTPAEVTDKIVNRKPEVVSRFTVLPQADPITSPALQVAGDASGLQISWPVSATNFSLQSATRLQNETEWFEETAPPDQVSEKNVLHLSPAAGEKFYRLKRH